MANHKSAEKRHRQSLKRRTRNRSVKSAVRTALSKAQEDITAGSSSAVQTARKAESALAKAAVKGVIHRKTAARKASRLAKASQRAKKS